ncbi:MAG: hypothetical protein QOF53_1345, partial [Nocardioidaceae bacterium]|nr:hypothetical protein [Nocardioidaceae bacterium]
AHGLPKPAPGKVTAALDPAVFGRWTTLAYKLPLRAIHATLLRTGKFLLIAGSGNVAHDHAIGNFKAYLWDPATDALTSLPVPYDAFCSGHLVDADGDVIVLGGTIHYKDASGPWEGSNKAYKFVVSTSTWVPLPTMKQGRWYPTGLLDGNGRVLAYSGQDATGATPATPEMYTPAANAWSPLAARKLPLYPSLHLLKDGRVAYTGAHYGFPNRLVAPVLFDPSTGASTTVKDPNAVLDLAHRQMGMSAIVGSADKQLAWVAGGGFPAVRSTYFIDLNAAAPSAVAGPPLAAAKSYVSVSHLPDLTALETGGGGGTNTPVFEASILNPSTRKLTAMAPPTVPRTYHSSSITMPDGRVVTFGGDPSGDANFELRIEIFSPPYLFKGTRPTITSHPTEVHYGTAYTVGTTVAAGSTAATAVLMRPGSATHSVDANARVLKLQSTAVAGGLQVTLPSNVDLAPPGWYLLFVDDSAGRPSVGGWVHLT